jgi:hypothetical protein
MAIALPSIGAPEASDVFHTLVSANDDHVAGALEAAGGYAAGFGGGFGGSRGAGAQLMVFAAAYTTPESRWFHQDRLIPKMTGFVNALAKTQLADGLWDSGNLDSPPDSAFVLKTLAKAQQFLVRDNAPATAELRARLKDVTLKNADGVRTGGVHTPNHRWAICTALAHVNEVYPDPRNLARIDDWLGEGIDVDGDGQWAERSPNYTSDVNDPSIMDLAIILHRPDLLDGVRRNLAMTLYHYDANGEVETIASRRQDQRTGARKYIWEYYVPYRYLAIHDHNTTFGAMARWIEQHFLKEVAAESTNMSSALTCFLEYPELKQPLPEGGRVPDDYAKVFPLTAMARIRHGATAATVYGGSDAFSELGVGSGIAMNPTFFKLRKGNAVVEVRMTPAFFGTGFFYGQGLKTDGPRYILSEELKVPYHLPLPPQFRRPDGQYKLSADMGAEGWHGRYYSKLDFDHRPSQFRTLESTVSVTEKDGGFAVAIDVGGYANVPVTIELAFRSDGTFSGVVPLANPEAPPGRAGRRAYGPDLTGAYALKSGTGRYTVGGDTIEFGPGAYVRSPGRMESESYTWVDGTLKADGERVYLTGITPFKHTLFFK